MDRFYWLGPRGAGRVLSPRRHRSALARTVGQGHRQGSRLALQPGDLGRAFPHRAASSRRTPRRADMHMLHIPIVDMQPPSAEQFSEALRFIDRHRARGEPVAVHCLMGAGRTGLDSRGLFDSRRSEPDRGPDRVTRDLSPRGRKQPSRERARRLRGAPGLDHLAP